MVSSYRKTFKIIYTFSIVFLLLSGKTFAQHYTLPPNLPKYDRNPYHFGFMLGLNSMNYVIHNSPDFPKFDSLKVLQSEQQMGFTIGIISNLRLKWDYADLRFIPSLSFGQQRLNYTFNKNRKTYIELKPTEVTNLEFPLNIKLKSQRFWNNTRAYVLGGIKYRIDLASQAKQKEQTDIYVVRLTRNDFAYEIGTGLDFYLVYFKFGIDLRMVYGLKDLIKRDNTVYTNSIQKLNSKMFLLSFTFE